MKTRTVLFGLISAALCGCAGGPVWLRGKLKMGKLYSYVDVYEVDLDAADAPLKFDRVRKEAAASGFRMSVWIDVGRSEKLANEHPTWIAGMGSHEDWRRKFPDAPKPRPGERIGVYPWTPIWYREVLENRRDAIFKLLKGRTEGIASVFLAHVQGAPSACGCGNDQCRWTVDYRMPGGPQRVDGSPAAVLIAGLKKDLPGVEWIPVWVTECEEADLPRKGSTGYCGTVPCFTGLCWKESTKEMEAVAKEATGPIAILGAERTFGRLKSKYEPSHDWFPRALKEVEAIPPEHGHAGWPASRLVAVFEAYGLPDEVPPSLEVWASALGLKGVLVSTAPLDESWEPRIIPAVTPTIPDGTPTTPPAAEKDAGHAHAESSGHD